MPMEESILNSVKKACGVSEDDTAHEYEIMSDINAVLLDLRQIGVSGNVASISGADEKWSDICSGDMISAVPSYVGLRVRLMFDPPASETLVKSIRDDIATIEWRLRIEVEHEQRERDQG